VIIKDFTHNRVTKIHLSLRGILRAWRGRWYEATFRHGHIQTSLAFVEKAHDYRFYNQEGEDLEHWLAANARGCYILEAQLTSMQGPLKRHPNATIRVRFTDRDSALRFKLTMGGSFG
jgi:hypothetical protein